MNIIIQSLGFTAGNSLESFIKEKINNLKSGNIMVARVTLFKDPGANSETNYCEIRLEVPGNDLYVKKNSAHFETSVSECVEVLSQALHKAAAKKNDRQADEQIIQDAMIKDGEDGIDLELEDIVK